MGSDIRFHGKYAVWRLVTLLQIFGRWFIYGAGPFFSGWLNVFSQLEPFSRYTPGNLTARPWKLMIGRFVSFLDCLFWGAMLNFWGVVPRCTCLGRDTYIFEAVFSWMISNHCTKCLFQPTVFEWIDFTAHTHEFVSELVSKVWECIHHWMMH